MSKPHLTHRQAEILRFIKAHIADYQLPPTQTEIMQAMGFRSRTAAKDHLQALQKKGVIRLIPNSARGIQLLPDNATGRDELPLVGRVAAGFPILALENIESHHAVDAGLFRPRADYLLRVSGESMIEAGIHDGDLLAVHQTPSAENGQIIVARLDDEVTVKRFEQTGHQVRLLPANPDFSPIALDLREQDLHIEGLMVGLIRQST